MKLTKLALLTSATFAALSATSATAADTLVEALTSGKASALVKARYEGVSQDNTLEDATALTVGVRAKYATADFKGFSAVVGVEASQALIEDYNNAIGDGGEYSVIADPNHVELDQAFLQYKADGLTVKAGRQILTLDNHRFIGHVGWRQDMQTFDAVSASYALNDSTKVSYAFLDQRNRIFSDEKDIDSSDHLLNISYKSDFGKFTGYAYFLEDDKTESELNTRGIRYNGKFSDISVTLETAAQSNGDFSTNYFLAEAATKVSGYGLKAGYEYLGSDDGKKGFATPLATLHKFNGWADMFLGTPDAGLTDLYATVSGKLLDGKFAVTAHKYAAAESGTGDDYGSEIDAVYTQKFAKKYLAGVKVAKYMANDYKVDTTKLWIWGQVKF